MTLITLDGVNVFRWNPFPATGDYVPAATRQTADAQFPIIIIPGRAAAGDATQPPAGAALILRPL